MHRQRERRQIHLLNKVSLALDSGPREGKQRPELTVLLDIPVHDARLTGQFLELGKETRFFEVMVG